MTRLQRFLLFFMLIPQVVSANFFAPQSRDDLKAIFEGYPVTVVYFNPFPVDFPPVQQLKDTMAAVSQREQFTGAGLGFAIVNLSEYPDLGRGYGISEKVPHMQEGAVTDESFPAYVVLFQNGTIFKRRNGFFSQEQLESFIQEHAGTHIARLLQETPEQEQRAYREQAAEQLNLAFENTQITQLPETYQQAQPAVEYSQEQYPVYVTESEDYSSPGWYGALPLWFYPYWGWWGRAHYPYYGRRPFYYGRRFYGPRRPGYARRPHGPVRPGRPGRGARAGMLARPVRPARPGAPTRPGRPGIPGRRPGVARRIRPGVAGRRRLAPRAVAPRAVAPRAGVPRVAGRRAVSPRTMAPRRVMPRRVAPRAVGRRAMAPRAMAPRGGVRRVAPRSAPGVRRAPVARRGGGVSRGGFRGRGGGMRRGGGGRRR